MIVKTYNEDEKNENSRKEITSKIKKNDYL